MVAVQMPLPGSPISNDSYEIQDPEARAHAAKEQATELARAQQYRMMAEEDTRELIFRLNEAEQSARIGSIQWDMATDRITLSEMAYHIIGMIPGSPVNRHKLAEQVHPADLRFVEDSIEKNLRDKVFKDFYFRMLTAQMETRFVLVKARIVRNDLGNAIMLKGTLQDVSELRAYMLRIDQQNRKLKRIAWLQSHRMRSPVATIMGMADLLNLQRHEDPVNVEVVRNIKDLTHKLDAMIHEVDSLTKQEEMV
jgi:hypothetical protein